MNKCITNNHLKLKHISISQIIYVKENKPQQLVSLYT